MGSLFDNQYRQRRVSDGDELNRWQQGASALRPKVNRTLQSGAVR